jgi:enolase
MQAIVAAGYKPGKQIAIALDCASSELFDEGGRRATSSGSRIRTSCSPTTR